MSVYAHCVMAMLALKCMHYSQCSNTIIKIINDKHMKLLTAVSSQFAVLPDDLKLLYVLKADDADMTKIAGQWLYHVNETYKNNKITQ